MVSSSNSEGNATSNRKARAIPPVTATVVGVIGKLPKVGRVEAKTLGESNPSFGRDPTGGDPAPAASGCCVASSVGVATTGATEVCEVIVVAVSPGGVTVTEN